MNYPSVDFFGINVTSILFGLGLIILFFLLIREFWTWYWKINKIVALLEEIRNNTAPAQSSVLSQIAKPILKENPSAQENVLEDKSKDKDRWIFAAAAAIFAIGLLMIVAAITYQDNGDLISVGAVLVIIGIIGVAGKRIVSAIKKP